MMRCGVKKERAACGLLVLPGLDCLVRAARLVSYFVWYGFVRKRKD